MLNRLHKISLHIVWKKKIEKKARQHDNSTKLHCLVVQNPPKPM